MDSPNKRQKTFASQSDYVPLSAGHVHSQSETPAQERSRDHRLPLRQQPFRDERRRQRPDRPKSKHVLPGCEPWILVRTKQRRRFVHNTDTRESLWRIPEHVVPAVREFEQHEKEQQEKADNAAWAEQQLQQMRPQQPPPPAITDVVDANAAASPRRRRRSLSLQREDEAALVAELAAQADDSAVGAAAVSNIPPASVTTYGYDSDGSYEEVEVTDDEGEDDGEQDDHVAEAVSGPGQSNQTPQPTSEDVQPDAPVEFGEDDIAWQLAAMGEDYGLDAGEYGDEPADGWEEGVEGLGLTDEDATNLFRDLLDDYRISPFTPWDRIITDDSPNSILHDDRYTVLPNMKSRREAFDAWAKDRAAQIQAERATMHKSNPRIPYLAFLQEKASPKLYWPEFKRKYKREAEMNDRKLSDKDREKMYRDHIARTKLSENTLRADLYALLKSVPLTSLNSSTTLDALPEQLLSHIHYISLPSKIRDRLVAAHIDSLPGAPNADSTTEEERLLANKKAEERRRRERALADREAKVCEERRRQEKEEMRARRDLREGERELQQAMAVSRRPQYS